MLGRGAHLVGGHCPPGPGQDLSEAEEVRAGLPPLWPWLSCL